MVLTNPKAIGYFKNIKIKRIQVFKVDLPLHEAGYKWGGGKSVTSFDAAVVKIETNADITGFGENTPLGPSYLPAFAAGTRAGIKQLAPSLIGENPTLLNHINTKMDHLLKGHSYVKSAVDMACWDILGKVTDMPVCELMGGRFGDKFPLYRAISQGTPDEMTTSVGKYLKEGYR
jgi:L-alanine-DL-glutamate epimerase-like enolase superfamily enzyme